MNATVGSVTRAFCFFLSAAAAAMHSLQWLVRPLLVVLLMLKSLLGLLDPHRLHT